MSFIKKIVCLEKKKDNKGKSRLTNVELLTYEKQDIELIITDKLHTNEYYVYQNHIFRNMLKNNKDKEYYEIILDEKINLYFDIDYYSDIKNEEFINEFIKILHKLHGLNTNLVISCASRDNETDKGKYKNSYHINAKNIIFESTLILRQYI